MIEAHELTRRYGPTTAVDGISFAVGEEEIVGILGPNGAGKTTTLRMITGFLPPTEGRVTVAGHDLLEEPRKARRQIGYLPENIALYPEMRVEEYLGFRARLQGLDRTEARRAIGEALERCLVEDVRRQTIRTLSKGYRQRVGLAQAILHRPRVLVLDEPTVGLDPKQIIAIRELIRELGGERTLLLSTHILPEVELLCDRVLIIDRGRIVGEGSPEELRTRLHGHAQLRVELQGAPPEAGAALAELPEVASVGPHPARSGSLLVKGVSGADPRAAIFHAVVARGWVLLVLEQERASLEDVFIRLTTHENGSGEGPTEEGWERPAAAGAEAGAVPAAAVETPAEGGEAAS
ncbi:MAG TPA: ABC transporter ATP-binding protein [Thermoanaerobaculia bacterium]|nr:ABC transporter ATP-binding protein [Thermoanaerobaculia bacterium]